jgi:glucose-1-phosphate thymidylyltransferase
MTTKAVILARGLGTRMRAVDEKSTLNSAQTKVAELGVKALIPIVGERTFLDFVVESLRSADFTETCLVIGDEHEILKDFCRKNGLSFVIQEKPLGTANAVLAAEKFANDEHFLVINSDNLYPDNALRQLQNLTGTGLVAFNRESLIAKSNISAEKIQKFAVIEFDENNYLTRIVEKPANIVENSFVSMNAWLFSPNIFEACKNIDISSRGEFELADAVKFAIENLGEKFKAVYSNGGVSDLSSRADIESVARKLTENGFKYK